jgi:hypothetical protein
MTDDGKIVEVMAEGEVVDDEVVDQSNRARLLAQEWVEEETGVSDGNDPHHQNWTLKVLVREPLSSHYC